ncbi:hypothetical protein TeGR_g13322, partial [Tetraparma gracilis]
PPPPGPDSTDTACTDCVPGKYSDTVSTDACISCDRILPKFNANSGSTHYDACQTCAEGSVPLPDLSGCEECAEGKYGGLGNGRCILCPANTYDSGSNSTVASCLACEPGTTSAPGSTECRLPTTISVGNAAQFAAAILDAGTGDTVELASDVTFSGDFGFHASAPSANSAFSIAEKVISVSCDDPAAKCTVSGGDERRAFYIFTNSRDEPAVSLTDIRFTAGRSPDGDISGGGGLRVYTSRIAINGCEFSSNVARYDTFNAYLGTTSGGASVKLSTIFISNSVFRDNLASTGGALYIDLSIVSLSSCTIVGNEANPKEAGGISVASSFVSILLCTIEGNVAGIYGGGLVTGGNFEPLLETSAQVGTEGIGAQLTGQKDALGLRLILSGVSFSDNVDENDAQAHDLFSYNANTVVRETCPAEDGYYFLAQEGTALTVNEGGTASGTLSSFTCLAQCAPGEDRKTSNHPCTVCEAGKYGNDGIFECSECPAGSYNEDTGTASIDACAACPPGSDSASAPSCTACPPGSFNPSSGSTSPTSCELCPTGTFNPSSSSSSSGSCLDCAAGKFGESAGAVSSEAGCTECSTGTYAATGSAECELCPAGTFNPVAGSPSSSSCQACLAGKSSEPGSTTSDSCTNCAAGSYSVGSASSCTLCQAGTYNSREGSEVEVDCEDCAPGTYNPAEGSESPADCQDCAAGTASSEHGATSLSSCGTCDAGSFAPAGSSTCTLCVAGRYSSEVGLERLDDCLLCAAGKASPLMGAANENACSACTPGSYSTGGNSTCGLCAAGSCEPGKYSAVVEAKTDSTCEACPNSLISNGGSSSPSNCYPSPSIFFNLFMTDPKERIFAWGGSESNHMEAVFEGEPLTSPTSFIFTSPTTFLVSDEDSSKLLRYSPLSRLSLPSGTTTIDPIDIGIELRDRFDEPISDNYDVSYELFKFNFTVHGEIFVSADLSLPHSFKGSIQAQEDNSLVASVDIMYAGEWDFQLVEKLGDLEQHIGGPAPLFMSVSPGPTHAATSRIEFAQMLTAGDTFEATVVTLDLHENPTDWAGDAFLAEVNDDEIELDRLGPGAFGFSKVFRTAGIYVFAVTHEEELVGGEQNVLQVKASYRQIIRGDDPELAKALDAANGVLSPESIAIRRSLIVLDMTVCDVGIRGFIIEDLPSILLNSAVILLEMRAGSKAGKTENEELAEEMRIKKHSEEELKVMVAALESVSKERQDELKEVMIESKEIKIDKLLGKGGFGVLLTVNEENVLRFRHECFLMKNLSHPNVVKLVGVCWSEELFACCLDFVENGSLEDWLRRTVGGKKYFYSEGWRPILPLNFVKAYPKLHALIQECWRVRRKERPNFDQIVYRLQHEIGDEIKRKEEPKIELYSVEDDLIYRGRIGKEDEILESEGEEEERATARTRRAQHETAMKVVMDELNGLKAQLAAKEMVPKQVLEQEVEKKDKMLQELREKLEKQGKALEQLKNEKGEGKRKGGLEKTASTKKVDDDMKNMLAMMGR